MTTHEPTCGAHCQCGYESPPCRVCNCGADERENVMQVAREMMTKWRSTLDWLAER